MGVHYTRVNTVVSSFLCLKSSKVQHILAGLLWQNFSSHIKQSHISCFLYKNFNKPSEYAVLTGENLYISDNLKGMATQNQLKHYLYFVACFLN